MREKSHYTQYILRHEQNESSFYDLFYYTYVNKLYKIPPLTQQLLEFLEEKINES